MKHSFFLLISISALLLTISPVWAEYFGMITDSNGNVELKSSTNGSTKNLLGINILFSDELFLDKNSSVTLVAHENCEELLIKGSAHIKIMSHQIKVVQGDKDTLSLLRELPACFIPDEIHKTNTIGGLTLRGNFDPVWKLRNEFKNGIANNATLITLINHDLENDKVERARPYFIQLEKKMPNSPYIENIARRFEN